MTTIAKSLMCGTVTLGTLLATSAAGFASEREREMTLQRWAWGTQGPTLAAQVQTFCGGGAQILRVERRLGDVAATLFTKGWYTPMTVHVVCDMWPPGAEHARLDATQR